jgi:hypothetical protein
MSWGMGAGNENSFSEKLIARYGRIIPNASTKRADGKRESELLFAVGG